MEKNTVIAMLIASKLFRDEELIIPKNYFESNGAKVLVASSSLEPSTGMLHSVVNPDITIKSISADEMDALVLVGGSGAVEYFDDQTVFSHAHAFYTKNKCLGAICIAPMILAHAGLLQKKKVTVYPSEADHIQSYGAIYINEAVVIDHNIITANGPQAALLFAQAIGKLLQL